MPSNGNGNGGNGNGHGKYYNYTSLPLNKQPTESKFWRSMAWAAQTSRSLGGYLILGPGSNNLLSLQRCNYPKFRLQARQKPSYRYEGKVTFRSTDGSVRILDDVVEVKTVTDAFRADVQSRWGELRNQSGLIGFCLFFAGGYWLCNNMGFTRADVNQILSTYGLSKGAPTHEDPTTIPQPQTHSFLSSRLSAGGTTLSWFGTGLLFLGSLGAFYRACQAQSERSAWRDDISEIQEIRHQCGESLSAGGGFPFAYSNDLKHSQVLAADEVRHLWNEAFVEFLTEYDELKRRIDNEYDFVRSAQEKDMFVRRFFDGCPLWAHHIEYAYGKPSAPNEEIRNPKQPQTGGMTRKDIERMAELFDRDRAVLYDYLREFDKQRERTKLEGQRQLKELDAIRRGLMTSKVEALHEACVGNYRTAADQELEHLRHREEDELAEIRARYNPTMFGERNVDVLGDSTVTDNEKQGAEITKVIKYYEARKKEIQRNFKQSIQRCSGIVLEPASKTQMEEKKSMIMRRQNADLIALEDEERNKVAESIFPRIDFFLGGYRSSMLKNQPSPATAPAPSASTSSTSTPLHASSSTPAPTQTPTTPAQVQSKPTQASAPPTASSSSLPSPLSPPLSSTAPTILPSAADALRQRPLPPHPHSQQQHQQQHPSTNKPQAPRSS